MTDPSPIRLLDLGLVPPVRSQTIYHAVAYALDETTPDTLILVAPTEPYVSIGFHQELEKEVDAEFCRRRGLPVVRREAGGGAVLLDRHQVFMQWVFHDHALPRRLEERFALYARPLVETYRALGIPATYRPINDVHVNGRKIGGTGAAQIGQAEVVVGSLMFDFDHALMAQVIRVSSEKMRDKVTQSLDEYLTTMKRQLGEAPDREKVVTIYLEQMQAALGRPIVAGELTTRELALAEALDQKFVSDEWLYQPSGLRQVGIKVHQDVRVAEAALKTPGGLVRVTARLHQGRIDDVTLSGDFAMLPRTAPGMLESALRGAPLEAGTIRARLDAVYEREAIEAPGVTPTDITSVVLLLEDAQAGRPDGVPKADEAKK